MKKSPPASHHAMHDRRIASEYTVPPAADGLSPRDRPREKLQAAGRHALGDHELIALVLGHGHRGRSALQLAAEVLGFAGGLHGLARTSVDQLAARVGLGPAKAARLVAAIEIGRRTLERLPEERLRFANPRELAHYLMPRYGAHPVERFGVVLFDARHQLIRERILAEGSLDAVMAQPRDVFRDAMTSGAAGIAVFHNHPSGDPYPSADDIQITQRLLSAGRILGIELIDHVVIGDAKYFSMREFGSLV